MRSDLCIERKMLWLQTSLLTNDHHDVRLVLNDGNVGRGIKLRSSVKEAILGNSSVRVDDEDVLSAANDRTKEPWASQYQPESPSDLNKRTDDKSTHIRMLPAAQAIPLDSSRARWRASS